MTSKLNKYINTEQFGCADMLSRLIAEHSKPEEEYITAAIHMENEVNQVVTDAVTNLPVKFEEIQKATNEDAELQAVIKYINTAWPPKQKVPEKFKQLFNKRHSVSVVKGCIRYVF